MFMCGLPAPVAPRAALTVRLTVAPPAGIVRYVPRYPLLLSVAGVVGDVLRMVMLLPVRLTDCAWARDDAASAAKAAVARARVRPRRGGRPGRPRTIGVSPGADQTRMPAAPRAEHCRHWYLPCRNEIPAAAAR